MFRKLFQSIALLLFATLSLTSCASPINPTVASQTQANSTPQPIQTQAASREAQVKSVEIQTVTADSLQVNVVVRGNLEESCATLGESQVQYEPNIIRITIFSVSPSNIGCIQTTTPFETTIPLNTKDLPAGTYSVIANGASTFFKLPIDVETPTSIPNPSSTVEPTDMACVDAAKFVSDVTIPDGTVVSANTAFTKTWRLENIGTCTWDSSYLVAYISGTTMTQQPGYWIVQQGQVVVPGQTVDVGVGMTAPPENGSYVSYWGLRNVDRQFMPIQGGANGNAFYAKIKVNNGIATGKITAASITIDLEQGSGPVCTINSTYFAHVSITADGPTTATYEIGSTAGQIPAGNFQDLNNNLSPYITGTVVFDQAGTKTINYRFVGPYPYPDDITVILRVNGGEWINTKLSCL